MTTFFHLLRREYWENRGAFLTTPIVVGALNIIGALLFIFVAMTIVNKVNGEEFVIAKLVEFLGDTTAAEREIGMDVQLLGLAALFNMVLFFVVFFYLLGALYDDRKDRSILFWKSLPVSDMETVLSKLVAATVLAPILMVIVLAITELVLMLITTMLLWSADMSAWEYLWSPADPLRIWAVLLVAYFVQALWMLPIWGWLLLISAFARSKPFLWAIVPPVVLGTIESTFNLTQYLRWDNNVIWKVLGERFLGGVIPLSFAIVDGDDETIGNRIMRLENGELVEAEAPATFSAVLSRLGEMDLWWGVIIGVLLVAAAIYIRRYRSET